MAKVLKDGTRHATGYWAEEFAKPYKIVTDAGHEVVVATPNGVTPNVDMMSLRPSMAGGEQGALELEEIIRSAEVMRRPLKLSDVRLEDYDAVYLPGGHGPMADLAFDADVGRLLTAQLASGNPLFIVCHGPAAMLATRRAGFQGDLAAGDRHQGEGRRQLQPRREMEAVHGRGPKPGHRAEPRLSRGSGEAAAGDPGRANLATSTRAARGSRTPLIGAGMRALRIHERGGPEHLIEEEAPLPTPTLGDALIRVHAASFTPTELTWPSTWIDRAGRDRRPVIPSHEVSGVVTALGYGTTGVSIGDAVYGLTDWYRDGAAAEYVAVEARNLAPKPTALDHATAAAVPMVALTAMQALFVHGRLERGQRVLVLGAGGGVGSFALQLARAAGAHVIAAARGWARDLARELGAERFVDVDESTLEDVVRDVELVFDLVGGEALARASAAVKAGGAVVSAVESPPTGGAAARRVFFVVEPNREQLAAVGARMAAGELRPIVGATWPLAEGRAAFAAKQRGNVAGKAVLRVVDDGGA